MATVSNIDFRNGFGTSDTLRFKITFDKSELNKEMLLLIKYRLLSGRGTPEDWIHFYNDEFIVSPVLAKEVTINADFHKTSGFHQVIQFKIDMFQIVSATESSKFELQ